MGSSSANAQTYLVGAYLFKSDSTGATTSATYQYDTNTNNTTQPLIITPNTVTSGKGFSRALSSGSNVFTFAGGTNSAVGSFGDLGLYFSTSSTPFSSGVATRTPDLVVARATDGSTSFFVPAPGTLLNNYRLAAPAVGANGASNLVLGSALISVSAFNVNALPTGSFTLSVITPEPGVVGLMMGLGVSGGVLSLRRRRRVVTK